MRHVIMKLRVHLLGVRSCFLAFLGSGLEI
jgi:hypothetical protein